MERSLQTRVSVVLLALFTAAAIVFAILNFNQENNFQTPTDGVWWVEAQNGLQAQRVVSNGPGQRAGIKTGDLLLSANGVPTVRWATLVREIFTTHVYNTINYSIQRDGVKLEVPVILDAQPRPFNQGFRLIALVYLCIGLYVLFRRWTAPQAGTVKIEAALSHASEGGDGVRGHVISSRAGELGTWTVHHGKVDTNLERVEVTQGETLDFVVDCLTNEANDAFGWSPVVTVDEGLEKAVRTFLVAGP